MTRRRSLSTKDRLAIFETASGLCHLCLRTIKTGEIWDADHVIPRAITGSDKLSEYRPAHAICHAKKTYTKDIPEIAKVKRIRAKHVGAWQKRGPPMPGTKRSKWKRKISGETVRR